MSIIPAQEIKRRGIGAVDDRLRDGPVHVVRSNRAQYVVMGEKDYEELMNELAEARLAASEADLKAGRVGKGSAAKLMREIRKP